MHEINNNVSYDNNYVDLYNRTAVRGSAEIDLLSLFDSPFPGLTPVCPMEKVTMGGT